MATPGASVKNFWLFLVYMVLLLPSMQALHCLVIRPGHGLISERCSSRLAASCRVRVENDAVVWYTSKLYDRNQLACVMRNEYGAHDRSGCIRKPSGSVRCWCYGQTNCNNPENMKKLYEAFKMGDADVLNQVVDDIETSDTGDYEEESGAASTAPSTDSKARIGQVNVILEKSQESLVTTTITAVASTSSLRIAPGSRGTGLHPGSKPVHPHRDRLSGFSAPPPTISSHAISNITTNRSSQKERDRDFELIQMKKTIKILPKTDDELNEEKELTGGQHIRVQNERKVRRKELGSGTAPSSTSKLLIDNIILFILSHLML